MNEQHLFFLHLLFWPYGIVSWTVLLGFTASGYPFSIFTLFYNSTLHPYKANGLDFQK
jgi:hypothetical protein